MITKKQRNTIIYLYTSIHYKVGYYENSNTTIKLIITSPNRSLFKYVVITVDVLYVVDAETPILAPFFVISPKLALNSKFVANVLVVSDVFWDVCWSSFSSIDILTEAE